MTKPPVSVWILVARTDLPYMMETIPHLMQACNYPFVERVLAMDTAPLTGDKIYRYKTGTQQDLEVACQTLIEQGVMDKIVKIDYDPAIVNKIHQKYFGAQQASQMQNHTHNWKGSTIYASLYCIEFSASNYYLHFDADMLLHQDPDYDWIGEAIGLIESTPTIVATRPLCGPPHPQEKLLQVRSYTKDPQGFYGHQFFSMRAYLVERERFSQLSPIALLWKYPPLFSGKLPQQVQPFFAAIERKLRKEVKSVNGALESLEIMVSRKLKTTNFIRADLASTKAWTIHPPQHSSQFIKALPHLIKLIEQGEYPLEQAGCYDLNLDAWSAMLQNLCI